MMKPTMDGSWLSVPALINSYRVAAEAVSDALEALELEAAPHGCDYYPQGAGAFSAAVDEHEDRCGRLRSVLNELHDLANHCTDALCAGKHS